MTTVKQGDLVSVVQYMSGSRFALVRNVVGTEKFFHVQYLDNKRPEQEYVRKEAVILSDELKAFCDGDHGKPALKLDEDVCTLEHGSEVCFFVGNRSNLHSRLTAIKWLGERYENTDPKLILALGSFMYFSKKSPESFEFMKLMEALATLLEADRKPDLTCGEQVGSQDSKTKVGWYSQMQANSVYNSGSVGTHYWQTPPRR